MVDLDIALSLMTKSLSASDPIVVMSANLDHIHHFAHDKAWDSLTPAQWIGTRSGGGLRWLTLLDGMPLVRTAKKLTSRRWPRLSGSDIIGPILESAAAAGARIGILGGTEAVHRELRVRVQTHIPSVRIAGTWAPSRSQIADVTASEKIAAEVKAARVDVLIVCLGKPRQEEWIARFGLATGARALLAFGAVVDFMAGERRRAPRYLADAGAEWAWRLFLEPRRLSRRYLIQGPPAWLLLKRYARIVEAGIETKGAPINNP